MKNVLHTSQCLKSTVSSMQLRRLAILDFVGTTTKRGIGPLEKLKIVNRISYTNRGLKWTKVKKLKNYIRFTEGINIFLFDKTQSS